jgi:MFS family permease/acetolactate synthase regulatory subunit
MSTHTISILVKNQPGVLTQISELFSHHGYNIEKIKADKYKKTELTKIKIAATVGEDSLHTLINQIINISNVVNVDIAVQRRYSFWLVAYCLCITLLGTNLPAPFYSVYRTEWQISSGMMTLLYAFYALIVIPTIIVIAQLASTFGRKRILFAGLSFSILGSLGFWLSNGLNDLLWARFFQGLSVGILNGIAVASMTDLDPDRDRLKSAFIAAIAGTLGNAIGPLISGFSGEYSPSPFHLAYMTHILLAVTGIIGLWFILDDKIYSAQRPSIRFPTVEKELRKPFLLASSTAFLSWGVMSLMLSVIPTYLELFTKTPSLVLSGTVVALVLGLSTLHQILLRNKPVRRSIITGYLCLILGLISLILTLLTKSLAFLLLTTVFIGLGNGPTFAGCLAFLNQTSTNKARAQITSSFFVITYLGISVPILTLGFIGEWIGLTNAILGFAGLAITFILFSLCFWVRIVKNDEK